jgi:hypothetical protein
MKGLGLILIAVGVVGLLAAANMDTSVEVPGQPGRTIGFGEYSTYIPSLPPQRVVNLSLMDQRRTWLTLSGLIALGGILLFGFAFLSEQRDTGTAGTVTRTVRPRRVNALGDIPYADRSDTFSNV